MADITCCSSATCYGLLTVGYMEGLISQDTCFSFKKGGTEYGQCCEAPSSSTVVNYSDANNEVYADKRFTDNNDPNNDRSGFVYVQPSRTYRGCCGNINNDKTILMQSEASFEYTIASGNSLTPITEPSICVLSYDVTETKSYIRHSNKCNGNTSTNVVVNKTHNQYTDGEIEKIFTRIEGITSAWTVSFTPSTKTINGLTKDCKNEIPSTIVWNFPEYVVGYNFDTSQLEMPIPCEGTDITLTFSSNTTCTSDFNISVSAVSINNQGIAVNDDTINISTNCSISQPIGETGRQAIISACTTNIHIGTNTNGYENGAIYIAYSANTGEITGETEYTFKRSLCAWYAGSVESPSCDEYWPIIDWTNPSGSTEPKDVQQIDKI